MKSIETAENWVGLLPGLLKIMSIQAVPLHE